MPVDHNIVSHLGTYVFIQRAYYYRLTTHLSINVNFTASDIRAKNRCCKSKGILFISNICNHQCTHILKWAADIDTPFNQIRGFNWIRKHLTSIAAWRTGRKALITLCNESTANICAPWGKCILDNNKYIVSWKNFLTRDLHTIHYGEHKHGVNTPGLLNVPEHIGIFNFKLILSQFSNAPLDPKSSESVWTALCSS